MSDEIVLEGVEAYAGGVPVAVVFDAKGDAKRQYICAGYNGVVIDMKQLLKALAKQFPEKYMWEVTEEMMINYT